MCGRLNFVAPSGSRGVAIHRRSVQSRAAVVILSTFGCKRFQQSTPSLVLHCGRSC
ncbi:hypothetical protein BDA96_10G138300 [Sorghum bicolor]|uniref:Uncharacterized protein n=1 Tax=Sorghum bicolor TaxID=4558 RepID=A0A921Q1D5_SORBI|nr:hypothetical protein BDA96_10G138300 [Sorghum bicolor]